MSEPFLILSDVRTHFPVHAGLLRRRQVGVVKAVDGVSLTLERGEVLGLVGESGCGKSTLARTVMQLIRPTVGEVALDGKPLSSLSRRELRSERVDFQMVFQDPYASLNPRMTVFDTLSEAIRTRRRLRGAALAEEVSALVRKVGLSARDVRKYPHEFSGGQRQRIAIARALAPEPRLVIADEPVSALDVSIQSQIINLILRLCREMQLTLIFISHDLSVVKYVSDRIAVMYLGRIVEVGDAQRVIEAPLHPYTKALVSAIPVPDPDVEQTRKRIMLQGDPPSPLNPPPGCPFHPRCAFALATCAGNVPSLAPAPDGRRVACLRTDEINRQP